jgi:hypothetical protein
MGDKPQTRAQRRWATEHGQRSLVPRPSSVVRRTCLLLLLAAVLIACSPEASRTRGGGPGADVGNHGTPVRIHDGAQPFFDTPLKGAGR